MKISIVGTGYVGLVTGVCLAEKGHEVTCVDIDSKKVEKINQAEPPFFEKGLPEILKRCVGKTFQATSDLRQAVLDSEVSFIAVGTPYQNGKIDLSQIQECAKQIGQALKEKSQYHVVVVKSTVVPGTTDGIVLQSLEKVSGKKVGQDFGLCMNPEFLREGEAVEDFFQPDRIVIGAWDERSLQKMKKLYSVFDQVPVVDTNTKTAEMIKYTSNSLLATMISFANEIGNLCANFEGVDSLDVMQGVFLDKRLSPISEDGRRVFPGILSYLMPGCGFGGSCFPKDVKALVSEAKSKGVPSKILESVLSVNEAQPLQMVRLLERHFPKLEGVKVSLLGVAFKPGTDDVRESPALPILEELLERKAVVTLFDPVVNQDGHPLFKHFRFTPSLTDAVRTSQALLLVTGWESFRQLPSILNELGTNPVVIDGRRFLNKKDFRHYEGIGLGNG